MAFQGIEVLEIGVQVQMAGGMPAFTVVGLPDKAVGERPRTGARRLVGARPVGPAQAHHSQSGAADVLKEGSHFDLPIAAGLLVAMGVLPAEELQRYIVLGELALDGALTAVAGVLPAAFHAAKAERGIICPAACGRRGGVGRRARGAGAGLADRSHKSFQGHPSADPAGARAPARAGGAARPGRHQGPGERQARARDCRGRWP
ncbi:MAG: magnesium chelatase domain-containing protein [Pseudomonadota bacterium]